MSKTLKQFKEQFDDNSIFEQLVQEVMSKDADAGAWIKDFVHSDNPKFAGKSKEQRKKMALGAYYAKQNEEVEELDEVSMKTAVSAYAKRTDNAMEHGHSGDDEGADRETKKADKLHGQIEKRWGKKGTKAANKAVQFEESELDEALKGNQHKIDKNKNNKIDAEDFKILRKEETVEEGVGEKVKTGLKKFLNKVGGGSDEDQLKRLRGNMYGKQKNPSNPSVKEEAEQVEEGWDDMVKAAKDSVKSGPKPSGGSGVKQGTRYGGGKQTSKPEQEEGEEEKKK